MDFPFSCRLPSKFNQVYQHFKLFEIDEELLSRQFRFYLFYQGRLSGPLFVKG